jgi:hypothetical protein
VTPARRRLARRAAGALTLLVVGVVPLVGRAGTVAAATSAGPPGPCIFTPVDFASTFLQAVHEPGTPANVEAVVGWEQAEGGNWEDDARFNPLNTTYVLDGSTPINGDGVQSYSSWAVGTTATVLTIENGLYGGILAALAKGDDPVAVARAVGASPWGTPDFENLLPPHYDPPAPPWEPVCLDDGTFVRVGTSVGVFEMAGGAPLHVSNWQDVGGPRPTVDITAARFASLAQYPADGTLLCAQHLVYVVAGGAPEYVGSWAAIGGPRLCVAVDPAVIANADDPAPWDHLHRYPADGTVLEAGPDGRTYVVKAGVATYAAAAPGPRVVVDPATIVHEGQQAPWDHLLFPVGYQLASADGTVFPAGDLALYGSLQATAATGPVVAVLSSADGGGYLEVTRNGTVAAFGDARALGDLPARHVATDDIVAAASTPDGGGYWLIGADGGMFCFGDARFLGSLPSRHIPAHDVVGMIAAPAGQPGYLLVGADGGIFAFGPGARYHGSLPALGVHVDDIRAAIGSTSGQGYVLVGDDGGAFVFGKGARFFGSVPGEGIHVADVVGIALTGADDGYWVAAADGTVYPFGAAARFAAPSGLVAHLPVVAISAP